MPYCGATPFPLYFPYDNTGYGVYRYKLTKSQVEKLRGLSIRYFKERRRFDLHFDMDTDSSLYCTEFVV